MDETTREMLNTIYIAIGTAGGIGALNEANAIIMEALDTGSVRDPAARLALRHLVTSSGTLSTPAQVKDEMAGVEEDTQRLHLIAQVKSIADKLVASAGALAVATGDDSLNRLPAWIKRHTAKLTTSTPIEDILAIADMVDELGAKFDRIKVDA